MKNTIFVLLIIFPMVAFAQLGDSKNEEKIKQPKINTGSSTLSFLYNFKVPEGPIGLKVAYLGAMNGAYFGLALSTYYAQLGHLTAGYQRRLSKNLGLYGGIGLGPRYIYDESASLSDPGMNMDSFALESGIIFNINGLALEFGIGLRFKGSTDITIQGDENSSPGALLTLGAGYNIAR